MLLQGLRKYSLAVGTILLGFIAHMTGHLAGPDFVKLAGAVFGFYAAHAAVQDATYKPPQTPRQLP